MSKDSSKDSPSSLDQPSPDQPEGLRVHIGAEVAKGQYSNIAFVLHTGREFVLDFVLAMPTDRSLVSRIITSPQHAKELHLALGENIKKFEEKFGAIEEQTSAKTSEFH